MLLQPWKQCSSGLQPWRRRGGGAQTAFRRSEKRWRVQRLKAAVHLLEMLQNHSGGERAGNRPTALPAAMFEFQNLDFTLLADHPSPLRAAGMWRLYF